MPLTVRCDFTRQEVRRSTRRPSAAAAAAALPPPLAPFTKTNLPLLQRLHFLLTAPLRGRLELAPHLLEDLAFVQ